MVELTNLKAQQHPLTHTSDLWSRIIEFVLGQLSLPWPSSQEVVIKPSNWANSLLDDLPMKLSDCIVTISSSIESYLQANLRGGDARICYSLNLLNSMTSQVEGLSTKVDQIERQPLFPLGNVLHLLTQCLLAQESALRRVQGRFEQSIHLTKERLLENPRKATMAASAALNLSHFPGSGADDRFEESLQQNAKEDRISNFSQNKESEHTEWLMKSYGDEISAACAWYAMQ